MTTALELQALAILDAATSAAIGLVVRTDNAFRAKQILYRFRRLGTGGDLRNLMIVYSPYDPDHELWIIRRNENLPAAEEE